MGLRQTTQQLRLQTQRILRPMGQLTESIFRGALRRSFMARMRQQQRRLRPELERLQALRAWAEGSVFVQPEAGQLCIDWGRR